MQPLKKQVWTEFLWRSKVDNAELKVKIRLEHCFAIK